MARKIMNRRKDKKIFKRTANKVAAANVNVNNYRGGIRL